MKILITGANGFIGQNLTKKLCYENKHIIFCYSRHSTKDELDAFTKECDFVFHLAGVNRPKDDKDYFEENVAFTATLLNHLKINKNNCPVMFSSSIQVAFNNPYGLSKKAEENLILEHSEEVGSKVYIYRFSNIFGKWAKPNYNSVVATFSHNIANELPISITNPDNDINLMYIDDVINELNELIMDKSNQLIHHKSIRRVYKVKLGDVANHLYSFNELRKNFSVPIINDHFQKKLYATFLSYLPSNKLIYDLDMHIDLRGSFTEFIKIYGGGQISINISKPGITKGNHWHQSKSEKFLVVSGEGIIRLRDIRNKEVLEYKVSGRKLQVVEIPPGYAHLIQNIGNTEMVTIIWANEHFDSIQPDTIFEEV